MSVNDDLLGTVRETVQPSHASLWLRPETTQKAVEEARFVVTLGSLPTTTAQRLRLLRLLRLLGLP
jgi:hypothetical protein